MKYIDLFSARQRFKGQGLLHLGLVHLFLFTIVEIS